MNKIFKKILIISIAIFGIGVLLVPPALAQNNNELIVEIWNESLGDFERLTATNTLSLFKETNFLPGQNTTGTARVTNNSGQPQRIATEAINYPGFPNPDNVPAYDLSRALSIIIREKDGSDLYGGTTGEKTLFDFYKKLGFNSTYEHVLTQNLLGNDEATYEFKITFPSEKENEWQAATTTFDILIGFQGTEGGIPPTPSPGGGGGLPPGLTITYETVGVTQETSVTITWVTNYDSTSQVIYGAAGEVHTLNLSDNTGTPPKYGYAHTTPEYDISPRVTVHSVTITGLTPGTTYYYRAVSHGSLAVSIEHSFTTLMPGGEVAGEAIEREFFGEGEEEGVVAGAATSTPETTDTTTTTTIEPAEEVEGEIPTTTEGPLEEGFNWGTAILIALLAGLGIGWIFIKKQKKV